MLDKKNKNIAIIPARGGSKRIPRKNIRDFCGQPIIKYSIDAAKKSGLFKRIIVSTDDEKIAQISRDFGAETPFLRSAKNSNDSAPLADVIEEVKSFYLGNGEEYDYICCILPTAPFITGDDLRKFLSFLKKEGADSVRPVVRFSYPIQRAIQMDGNKIRMFDSKNRFACSQDFSPAFHDAGQFYWMKFSTGLYGENKYGLEISILRSQDIDIEEDWILAELKYKCYTKNLI